MRKNNQTGSRLFFIEFLIVLFFFLIVSTVCLRLFARAHMITQRADTLSHAQTAAASVAAAVEYAVSDGQESPTPEAGSSILLRAKSFLPDAFLTQLPDSDEAQEGLAIAYDRDFAPCAAEDAYYLLTASLDGDGQSDALETLCISVSDFRHTSVYELSASFHRALTREEVLQ